MKWNCFPRYMLPWDKMMPLSRTKQLIASFIMAFFLIVKITKD